MNSEDSGIDFLVVYFEDYYLNVLFVYFLVFEFVDIFEMMDLRINKN